MRTKKVIGLDIDGVLANNLEPFLKFIGYYYKQEFELSQITNPSISVSLNLPKHEIISLFEQFDRKMASEEIIIEPLFDLSIANKLNSDFEVDIITKRTGDMKDYTISWLRKHGLDFRHIYMLEDLYHGKKSSIECDIYVDDDPRNLHELWVSTDKKIICTIDNSYNQGFIKNMHSIQNGYFIDFKNFSELVNWLS